MRIHLNLDRKTTEETVRGAAQTAHVNTERVRFHGSRSHTLAVDVLLSGDGNTGGQWGNSGAHGAGPYKAATWDQWGIFLARIFEADATAKAGPYDGADHFYHVTAGRFATLTYAQTCPRHRWDYVGDHAWECPKCGGVTYARLEM